MKKFKTMELVKVSDVMNQRGRHPEKCCCGCGVDFSNDNKIVKINAYGFGSGSLYAHYDCIKVTLYGNEERENIGGTNNTTFEKTPRVSVELEMFNSFIYEGYSQTDRQNRAMKALLSGEYPELTDLYLSVCLFGCKHGESIVNPLQQIGLDSSTALEGHLSELSIEGMSKLMHNLTNEQIDILTDDHNGMHIHAERVACNDNLIIECFKYFIWSLEELTSEERVKRFGSDFRHYSEAYVGYKDDDIYPSVCIKDYTIEFRLPRFTNPDNTIRCIKYWRGVVKLFNSYVPKLERGDVSIAYVGKKLARENFYATKYAKGR